MGATPEGGFVHNDESDELTAAPTRLFLSSSSFFFFFGGEGYNILGYCLSRTVKLFSGPFNSAVQ